MFEAPWSSKWMDVKWRDKCLKGNEGSVKAKQLATHLYCWPSRKYPLHSTPKILGTSNVQAGYSLRDSTAALICSRCFYTYTNIEHIISAVHSVRKHAALQCHLALQHCHPTVGFRGFSEVLCHIILQWNEIYSMQFTVKQGRRV